MACLPQPCILGNRTDCSERLIIRVTSPVSREVAGVAVVCNALAGDTVLHSFPDFLSWVPYLNELTASLGWLALLAGPIALYAMHNIYRIKARPYWNHWQVLTTFYGNTLSLGSMFVGLVYFSVSSYYDVSYPGFAQLLAWPLFIGLAMEMVGLYAHQRYLCREGGEAYAAHVKQTTGFWLYLLG